MSSGNNSFRGPLNAFLLYALDGFMHMMLGKSKQKLFSDHPDVIVEIGSGTGSNMRYLRTGTKLIAVEPNKSMHKRLRQSAEKYGIDLEIRGLKGEKMDLPDDYCEFVVSTLVLCSVDNPKECIDQVKRVLKPKGRFVFIEHVKGKDSSFISLIQNLLHKPWHWLFEGCHTNRDTAVFLQEANFAILECEAYNLYSPFIPIIPQIRGIATK